MRKKLHQLIDKIDEDELAQILWVVRQFLKHPDDEN